MVRSQRRDRARHARGVTAPRGGSGAQRQAPSRAGSWRDPTQAASPTDATASRTWPRLLRRRFRGRVPAVEGRDRESQAPSAPSSSSHPHLKPAPWLAHVAFSLAPCVCGPATPPPCRYAIRWPRSSDVQRRLRRRPPEEVEDAEALLFWVWASVDAGGGAPFVPGPMV
jgi:hypothetical protein